MGVGGDPILPKVWIILSPFCISILKVLSTKMFIIHYISMHYAWFRSNFLRHSKFLQIKEGPPYFLGRQFRRKSEVFGTPLLYFNFKNFMDPNSLSFIRLQCILHDSGLPFSDIWNFCKLKWGNLISGVKNSAESLSYFVLPSVFQF